MSLELAQGIIRIKIDRAQLRAEIKSARQEIMRGLSGIRVKVDIDTGHFKRAAASAGRQAGQAAGRAASQAFNQTMRGGGTGMVPSGGTGMIANRGMMRGGGFETSPGTFLLPGPGQRRIGTTAGGRAQRNIGGSPFSPAGFLGGPGGARGGGGGGAGGSPWGWAGMYGGMGGPAAGGGRRGGGGRGGGGRGFHGMGAMGGGGMGSFAGGFSFGVNPMLAASGLYGGPAGAAGYMTARAGAAGIKEFADFEEAINWVKILQRESGSAEGAIASLEEQARKLGRTTTFSATEAAQAMAVLTKRGFDATEVYQQIPHILNLAAAGELEIADAAEIVASTQKQFGLEAKDSQEIVDLLAKASLDSASDVQSLGVALSYVGPVAHQAGLGLKETLAVIMMLEDGGLKSSRAGTGLARVLAKLANAKTEDAFRQIGVEVRDAGGEFRSMEEITGELSKAMKELSSPDRMAFINALFRERGGLALSTLMVQEKEALQEAMAGLEMAGDTSGRIAEERMKALNNQFEMLKNSLADLGIEFGKTFGTGLADLLKNTREELEIIRVLAQPEAAFGAEVQGKVNRINELLAQRRGDAPPAPMPDIGPVVADWIAPGAPAVVEPTIQAGFGGSGAGRGGRRSVTPRRKGESKKAYEARIRTGGMNIGAGGNVSGGMRGGLAGLAMADALRRIMGKDKGALDIDNKMRAKKFPEREGFRPQITGIEEFQRDVQLGVLDKKDKHLENIATNTKKTAEGIAGLQLGGGGATFS